MLPWMGALEDNLDVLNVSDESGGEWGSRRDGRRPGCALAHQGEVAQLHAAGPHLHETSGLIIDEAQNLTPKQMKDAGDGARRSGHQGGVPSVTSRRFDTPYLTEGSSGLSYVVDRMKDWATRPGAYHGSRRGERSRLADHRRPKFCRQSAASQPP